MEPNVGRTLGTRQSHYAEHTREITSIRAATSLTPHTLETRTRNTSTCALTNGSESGHLVETIFKYLIRLPDKSPCMKTTSEMVGLLV